MNISTNQIEVFLAIANSKSISKAAKSLYISQASASTMLTNMEKELGVTLVQRSNHGVTLTDDGLRLFFKLFPVFQRFRIDNKIILEASSRKPPLYDIRLGSQTIKPAVDYMTAASILHSQKNCSDRIYQESFIRPDLIPKLLSKELDVIFLVSTDVYGRPEIDYIKLEPLDLFFLYPKNWVDRVNDTSNLSFLRNKTLLIEYSTNMDALISFAYAHGAVPGNIRYINSRFIPQLVANGEGFSISYRHVVTTKDAADKIAFLKPPVRESNQYLHLVAAWRKTEDCASTLAFLSVFNDLPKLTELAKSNLPHEYGGWYY